MQDTIQNKNQEITNLLAQRGKLTRRRESIEKELLGINADLINIDRRLDICDAHLNAFDFMAQQASKAPAADDTHGAVSAPVAE